MSASGQSSVVPYLVLGDARRAALAEHVRVRVERWRKQWNADEHCAVDVEVLDAQESVRDGRLTGGHMHDAECFRVSGGPRPVLVMVVPARCFSRVIGILGDVGESIGRSLHEPGLAEQLELEALRLLAREFRSTDALEATLDRSSASGSDTLREYASFRYGCALVRIGQSRQPFVLLMSPELMSAAIPVRGATASVERLERRKAAIAEEPVDIEAVLGEGIVSVNELAALAVGDVIVLEQKLSESACLSIRGGGRIVGAAPGRLEALRAVQITSGKGSV
jgi:flagellar motor switch/type III secretory pathway protein FliN